MDTAHFYAVPELAWQTLLKRASEYCEHEVTCKECELCPDKFIRVACKHRDMLMFEKDIRSGITPVKGYAKDRNKYMKINKS